MAGPLVMSLVDITWCGNMILWALLRWGEGVTMYIVLFLVIGLSCQLGVRYL